MIPKSLTLGLIALGIVLTATVVPGVFTVDEDNYLVTVIGLRHGQLTVPGTQGLPPTGELLYFDPDAKPRLVTATPVSSTAPPLYSWMALPFSFLGWRGLVVLNTLAFLGIVLIVFLQTQRISGRGATPWLAAAIFAAGGYSLEYAQGMWPQMLSVVLVCGGVLAAFEARSNDSIRAASLGGLLLGLAAGVRYQNVLLGACLALTLVVFSKRRLSTTAAFGAAMAVPLSLSSLINHARLGQWNPISKGPRYLRLPSTETSDFLRDGLVMAWARIVDFAHRPPLTGSHHEAYLRQDPITGAYLVSGGIKKAWLQSSPWMLLPLILMVTVWIVRRVPGGLRPRARTELLVLSLLVFPVLGMFSITGIYRTDGLCFNQRYFLELVPLVAIACALCLEGRLGRWRVLIVGALAGLVLAELSVEFSRPSALGRVMVLKVPLILAVSLLAGWLSSLKKGSHRVLAVTLGLCLGWSLGAHLFDDVLRSRERRQRNLRYLQAVRDHLKDGTAVFAYWGEKDALGPLQLDLDIVVADPWIDDGKDSRALLDALQEEGRRAFVLADRFPRPILDHLLGGRLVKRVTTGARTLLEVGPHDGAEPPRMPPETSSRR